MTQIIIYPTADEGVAVIRPVSGDATPIEEIARRDVPAGLPYIIANEDDLPVDRDDRHRWQADFTNVTGLGIGADAWHAEAAEAKAEAAKQTAAERAKATANDMQRQAAELESDIKRRRDRLAEATQELDRDAERVSAFRKRADQAATEAGQIA